MPIASVNQVRSIRSYTEVHGKNGRIAEKNTAVLRVIFSNFFNTIARSSGFALAEALMVLLLLTAGLLAAGRLLVQTMSSLSLARSKGVLAVAAQSKLESLAELYARDPGSAALQDGDHGPEIIEIQNPSSGRILHKILLSWSVRPLSDPRPGKKLRGKIVTVTAAPTIDGTSVRYIPGQNKIFYVTSVFTPRWFL